MVTGHSGMGTDGRSGSVCHQSWPLVLGSLGKKSVNVSFLGLLCSCLRPDQVQTDSDKDRKWIDMGFTSQTELLPPPRFYLWNA